MGFPSSSAEQAVEVCGDNLDKAVHLLTTGELIEDPETRPVPQTTDESTEDRTPTGWALTLLLVKMVYYTFD